MAANRTAEGEGRPGRRGIALLLLGLALAGAAGAGYWNAHQTDAAAAGSGPTVKSTLHLETFVINLADPEKRAYLRVGIDLGLAREMRQGEEVPVAQIRDTILGVLSQSRANDLLTEAGKTKLKADLLQALEDRLPGQKVREVYFTELLIQK